MTGKETNYETAHQQAKNFGLNLKGIGLKKGDVLALVLPNCIEYPLILSGAAKVGVTSTPLNPAYTHFELAKQVGEKATVKSIKNALQFFSSWTFQKLHTPSQLMSNCQS